MSTKICVRCGQEKPIEVFKLAWKNAYRKNQCNSCCSRQVIAKYKLDFLKAFDYKCSCCGERQPYFLTLDHVNNDGAEHRRTKAQVSILAQARREHFDKTKWDCLCMNCNFAKGHYEVCPHKQGLSPEAVIKLLQASSKNVGRKHHDSPSRFKGGFDERRMQLSRRSLKPCPFCSKDFGTNEMARHKRTEHAEEMEAKRQEILAKGRQRNVDGSRLEC